MFLPVLSPLPFMVSFSVLGLIKGGVFYFYLKEYLNLLLGFMSLILCFNIWLFLVKDETSLHKFKHTPFFRFSFILFIASEVLFFFSFFWSFFHCSMNSDLELGCLYPPYSFEQILISPLTVPLLNSVLLLSSGSSITASHHYMLTSNNLGRAFLIGTMVLGLMFLVVQVSEYTLSYFNFDTMVYGSTFFLLTGFHGFHVLVGCLLLLTSLNSLSNFNQSSHHHLIFELSSWYWHFVDVVRLYLYFFLYFLFFTI